MNFIDEAINHYAEEHSGKEPDVLQELNRETYARILYPRMLSGHMQGRVLSAISRMIRPKRILEIGTYTGYSAICLAEGLQENGRLITIDENDELASIATKYFEKAGLSNTIQLINGDATKIIPTLEGTFDLVFIDADKINYENYFRLIIDKVPNGGWLLADNVLWSGNILQEQAEQTKETRAIDTFNKFIAAHPGLFKVLLPIRDGLFLMQKLP